MRVSLRGKIVAYLVLIHLVLGGIYWFVVKERPVHLRDERLKLQEQHYFLDRVLNASPAGILTLDFDERADLLNPSAEKLVGVTGSEVLGLRLAELAHPLGVELAEIPVGESRMLVQGHRRIKVSRAELFDRGFPRGFLIVEELAEELRASEKAAYGKLIRLMSQTS